MNENDAEDSAKRNILVKSSAVFFALAYEIDLFVDTHFCGISIILRLCVDRKILSP